MSDDSETPDCLSNEIREKFCDGLLEIIAAQPDGLVNSSCVLRACAAVASGVAVAVPDDDTRDGLVFNVIMDLLEDSGCDVGAVIDLVLGAFDPDEADDLEPVGHA